jgi:hypothetical protein
MECKQQKMSILSYMAKDLWGYDLVKNLEMGR